MDAAAEIGRNPVSKHQIQPEYGDEQANAGQDCRTRLARPNSQARTWTGKCLFFLFSWPRAGLATLSGWSILLLYVWQYIERYRPTDKYLHLFTLCRDSRKTGVFLNWHYILVFVSWEVSLFFEYFCIITVSPLNGEYLVRFSSGWCFSTLWPRAGVFTSAYVIIQSIK